MPNQKISAIFVACLVSSVAASSCSITKYTDLDSDTLAKCTDYTIGAFEVPAGETLNFRNILDGTKLTFTGELTFGYEEWEGPLVKIGGQNIVVVGKSGHSFNGDGSRWWDTLGTNGGKTKPKFFDVQHLNYSSLTGLKVVDAPAHVFSISGNHNIYDTINVDISAGNALQDGVALGHNTDAFDVGSVNNLTIQNSWVSNQDDCLAVNSGKKVKFLKNTCIGSHGISVGSVGGRDDNTVDDVLVQGNTVDGGENGLRIKTKGSASSGSVNNVRWLSNTLKNSIKYCVYIRQDYTNSGTTEIGTKIPITDVTLNGLTLSSGGECTQAQTKITCGNCSNFSFKDVTLTGKKGACVGIDDSLPLTGCA